MLFDDLTEEILALDRNTCKGKQKADDIFTLNPALRHVLVEYTYQHDGGSDGWYTENCDGSCTLATWLNGEVHHRHPGNRSYNFRFKCIKDSNYDNCVARRDAEIKEYEDRKEKARQELAAQRAREASALGKRDAEMHKYRSGTRVSHKGAFGVVERVMVSRFNDNKVCAFVRFDNGAPNKWHGTGALKVAPQAVQA